MGVIFRPILKIALELAMHGHVEPDVFLPAHRARRFFFQKLLVLRVTQRSL